MTETVDLVARLRDILWDYEVEPTAEFILVTKYVYRCDVVIDRMVPYEHPPLLSHPEIERYRFTKAIPWREAAHSYGNGGFEGLREAYESEIRDYMDRAGKRPVKREKI